jgi:DNA polymerase I
MAYFREIWLVDFEFRAPDGERPEEVHCLVGYEIRSGRTIRLWRDQFGPTPPYSVDEDSLFVAYYASAEVGCHLALGWPAPARILDLCAEFKALTSGLSTPTGKKGLLDALAWFGIGGVGLTEKKSMQDLAIRGGPFTHAERRALLDYCETDVVALERLLPRMLPGIDIARALVRGRYMAAAARMEWAGIPIDVPNLERLLRHWPKIKARLIPLVDVDFHVFDEFGSFKEKAFEAYVERAGLPWPRLDSGRLDRKTNTFRDMANIYPAIAPLKELMATLSLLRNCKLAVGADGRNRTVLGTFGTKTGRNAPSNARYIFGPAVWLRALIKPPPGWGIGYIDWEQQEVGIAAALSGDKAMKETYRAADDEGRDVYIEFGIKAGILPRGAKKKDHEVAREGLKQCVLGMAYGMGEYSLAVKIKQSTAYARELIDAHRIAYPTFWQYDDGAVDRVMQDGEIRSVLGWPVHRNDREKVRANSFRNFPMQSNGAEMMRIAACLMTEAGIEVCGPVHDAFLIAAPLERLDADIVKTRAAMAEASRIILDGFELRTDVKVIRYPERYRDKRDDDVRDANGAIVRRSMWGTVWAIIEEI